MKEARVDPATWASGGGTGGSGSLSPDAKATVVADLKRLIEPKEDSIVTLRTTAPSLVHALSDATLLLLGAKDVGQAQDPDVKEHRAKWLTGFLANLRSCLVDSNGAFPGFKIENNTTGSKAGIKKGRALHGRVHQGPVPEIDSTRLTPAQPLSRSAVQPFSRSSNRARACDGR